MRLVSSWFPALMIVAVSSALAAPTRMVAQGSPTGTLTGTVSDPTGAVLPGVTVAVKSVQTGMTQQTTTDTNGEWRIPALPVGTYEVSFELQGFKRLVRDGIIVEAAATRSVPASLAVGGLAETVNVTGDANLLSTTTVTTVRSITSAEIQSVPTSTGSFTHLLSSEAGVSADLPPVLTNGTGNISPSVNGTRTTSTSLFFNGIDATNLDDQRRLAERQHLPASDMLQEITLQTSMYDASTGRSGGGNFQLVTRSGTNALPRAPATSTPAREDELERFLLRERRDRQTEGSPQRGGFTIGGPIRAESDLLFWRISATRGGNGVRADGEQHRPSPQALQLIDGRPHEGKSARGVLRR